MFTCEIVEKIAVLDDYEQGEIQGSGQCCGVDLEFENETLQGLIDEIIDFFGVSSDDIYTANGAGIINIFRSENADGEQPTDEEFSAFREGKFKLWNVTYQGVVHCVFDVSEDVLNGALNSIA